MCTPKVYHRIYAVTQTISQPVLAPCTGTQAGTEALRRCPRPSPAPRIARELRCSEQTFFFFVRSGRTAPRARRRVWAPTVPQLARGPRGSTVLPGRRQRNHPPATPSPLLARQVRRRCATRPRRSALVDSGACSIRSGARVQLGMRKGDHDMVHGLACMRGCSLVVQRVERGANFKNRV